MTKTAAPKVSKKIAPKRAKILKLSAPKKVAAKKAVKALECPHEYKNEMDWNINLRRAIERSVNVKKMAERFSMALEYTYVFDLLREDESLPMPEYGEFEYRDVGLSGRLLTCRQLNSDVEVGVKINRY